MTIETPEDLPREPDFDADARRADMENDAEFAVARCRCGGVIRQPLMGPPICGSCGRTP